MATSGHPDPRVSSSRPRPGAAATEYNRHHIDRNSHRHRAREPYPSENPKESSRYADHRHRDRDRDRDRDYRDRPPRHHSDAPDARLSDKSRSSPSDEGHSSDRESGELSISRSTEETSGDMKRSRSSSLDNGASSSKNPSSSPAVPVKRKFTPIVWDLDEKKNSITHGSGGRRSRSPVVSAKVSSTAPRAGNIGQPVESGRSRSSSDDYIDAEQRNAQVRNRSAISPNESSGRQLSACDVNDETLGEDPTTHQIATVSTTRTSRWASDDDEEDGLHIRTSRWAKDDSSPASKNGKPNAQQSSETMTVRTSRWADKEESPPRKQQVGDQSSENIPTRTSRWAEAESSIPNENKSGSMNEKLKCQIGTDSDEEDGLISPNERQEQLQEGDKAECMSPEPGEYVEEKPVEEGDGVGRSASKENDDGYSNDDVEMNDRQDERDVSDSEHTTRSKERYSDQELSDLDSEDEAPATPPNRSIDMLRACRSVNDFEKLNRVNEGTYGVVYKARDKKTGEIVALKKVKMEKEREGFPITSLREINILLSIRHPSIVNVKEVVVGGNLDSIFMVMEYMENDLKRYVETLKHPLNERDVKRLMRQLFEGMKYLHDNWIVHRDLKTSNLLLNSKGELKICDFGLARQYGTPLKTYTNNVVTLWYRAPELLLGCKHYSTAVDMWSLGCIMAELLAKEPLFNGNKEIDQLNKIFKVLGTPNEEVWPEYPNLLKNVKVGMVKQKYNKLREKFPPIAFGRPTLSETGFNLLSRLLLYDPNKRLTAEEALNHDWFVKDEGS